MTSNPEAKPKILRKVALAHLKDKKILMVRDNKNDKVFLHLGGKVEEGETDIECLAREVKEELGVDLNTDSLEFLNEFEAPAHDKPNTLVNIRLYGGYFTGQPRSTEEIVEFKYFDSLTPPESLSLITKEQIFPWLKLHGYIN